jgi:hypothetical protein
VLWAHDWLNSSISHRTIRVHLRPSAAKNPFFLYHAATARSVSSLENTVPECVRCGDCNDP